MTSFILYSICIILCMISFKKDKEKTKQAFINGLKSLENIMPQFLFIAILVGIILSILYPASISNLIGKDSALSGITISSILGSITTIPTFVAASFISTSTMVGLLTFSLEAKYIGKKAAFYRNCLAFIFSFVVAIMIGGILG